jgi:hypothetical protein
VDSCLFLCYFPQHSIKNGASGGTRTPNRLIRRTVFISILFYGTFPSLNIAELHI